MREFSRRDLLQAAAAGAVGLGAGVLLRSTAPVGRDIGLKPTVTAVLGDPAAPVRPAAREPNLTMAVFTDYQCPACKVAHPAMQAALARDGRVRTLFKEWPIFGEPSKAAARVALAADGLGIYPRFHDALMRDRRRPREPVMREAAEAAGGDWSLLARAAEDRRDAIDRALARNALDAFSLGLRGTPAYLIGPILVEGAIDEFEFLEAFEQARQA